MNNFNNMYQPGNMYNNNIGGYAPSGYTQQTVAPHKTNNVLTKEEIKALRKSVDTFSLGLTEEEMLRGICFHKDENGQETLKDNGDGTVTCTVCGYTFDPLQSCTEDDLQRYVDNITDVLQTIKLLYIDMPTEAAREYFQIIPLINKAPKLFKIASDNFNRHENYNNYRFNGAPNTINLYNMLSNGTFNTGFAPQQQPYPQQYGATPFTGAPMPQYGAPATNGFGFGAPVAPQPVGYQPVTTGFGYTPNQTNINNQPTGTLPQQPQQAAYTPQAPLAAPSPVATETVSPKSGVQAPTAAAATTDGQEVKVNATFKS